MQSAATAMTMTTTTSAASWWGRLGSWWRWPTLATSWVGGWSWRPTSSLLLARAEEQMLRGVQGRVTQEMVEVEEDHHINTITIGRGPPLVLLHGFAAGVGHWACNLDALAKHHTVYAIDLIGFGRSSRPYFSPSSASEAEDFFVKSLEGWRNKVGLERFSLLGHSFGGYLSACYSLKHPQVVDKLILADPWGIPHWEDKPSTLPLKWRLVKSVLQNFSPLSAIRWTGPYGPALIHKMRPDLSSKWIHYHKTIGRGSLIEEDEQKEKQEEEQSMNEIALDSKEGEVELPTVVQYIYHCNAQVPPTGEIAFHRMMKPVGWAASPLMDRLPDLDPNIPVTFLYGEKSWMDPKAALEAMSRMKNKADLVIIPGAGHHVYVDNISGFNTAVLNATLDEDRAEEASSTQDSSDS